MKNMNGHNVRAQIKGIMGKKTPVVSKIWHNKMYVQSNIIPTSIQSSVIPGTAKVLSPDLQRKSIVFYIVA